MPEQRQREPRAGVHADAAIAHVHHHDEVEHFGVEALAGIEVGDGECHVRDACERDHDTPLLGGPDKVASVMGLGQPRNRAGQVSRTHLTCRVAVDVVVVPRPEVPRRGVPQAGEVSQLPMVRRILADVRIGTSFR